MSGRKQGNMNETMREMKASSIAISKVLDVIVVAKNSPMLMSLGSCGAEGLAAVGGDLNAGGGGCPNL